MWGVSARWKPWLSIPRATPCRSALSTSWCNAACFPCWCSIFAEDITSNPDDNCLESAGHQQPQSRCVEHCPSEISAGAKTRRQSARSLVAIPSGCCTRSRSRSSASVPSVSATGANFGVAARFSGRGSETPENYRRGGTASEHFSHQSCFHGAVRSRAST